LSLLADNLSQLQLIATSLDEIAKASGFWSAEVLRRAFARRLGVTPVTWPAMLIQAPQQQRNLVFWLAIRKLRLMDGAELQWLRWVKRGRVLQGCNHAEGQLNGIIEAMIGSVGTSFLRCFPPIIGSKDPMP
jgi:hypothetical protein